jgi:4'-phosphopantetheinyl transferase
MHSLINDFAKNSVAVAANDLTSTGLTLRAGEVHVWHANLDDHPADDLKVFLADDEISRANRFHFAKDRNHYLVARGLLRKLLGGYAGAAAGELRFAYAEKGKPRLAESHAGLVSFNLAHSHARAIYAFSVGREVGVDLEFMRADFAGSEIAKRFFSTSEVAALAAVPTELRHQAFFDCWTRKEAYIKARGDGLSMPLDKFDVAFAPGEEAALLRNHQDPKEVTRWLMKSIPAPDGYVAALVVESQDWSLKTFRVV